MTVAMLLQNTLNAAKKWYLWIETNPILPSASPFLNQSETKGLCWSSLLFFFFLPILLGLAIARASLSLIELWQEVFGVFSTCVVDSTCSLQVRSKVKLSQWEKGRQEVGEAKGRSRKERTAGSAGLICHSVVGQSQGKKSIRRTCLANSLLISQFQHKCSKLEEKVPFKDFTSKFPTSVKSGSSSLEFFLSSLEIIASFESSPHAPPRKASETRQAGQKEYNQTKANSQEIARRSVESWKSPNLPWRIELYNKQSEL